VKRLKLLLPAIALVTVFAMAPAANSAVVVKGSGSSWRPRTTTINKGVKVVWKAVSGSHTVTAYKGAWSKNTSIPQGSSTSFTFKNAGTYKFYCKIHGSVTNGVCSGMCGKIVVG
jgi:plastocyanin